MRKHKESFVFLGAGNLATHLSFALKQAGYEIIQVYSRTEKSAKILADKLDAAYTNNLANLNRKAAIYVLALTDDFIRGVIQRLDLFDKLVIHTAGSLSIDIFKGYMKNYGVFYPLQTFSKTRTIDFKNIPIFIEANDSEKESELIRVAENISNKVSLLNSDKRKYLHLAAVFACNFVNHMYTISHEIAAKEGIPFDVLKPLITETSDKVMENLPLLSQTGPAVRNNKNIIKMHLDLLSYNPQFHDIYKKLSDSIIQLNKKNKLQNG